MSSNAVNEDEESNDIPPSFFLLTPFRFRLPRTKPLIFGKILHCFSPFSLFSHCRSAAGKKNLGESWQCEKGEKGEKKGKTMKKQGKNRNQRRKNKEKTLVFLRVS